jgi:hypothetical protein
MTRELQASVKSAEVRAFGNALFFNNLINCVGMNAGMPAALMAGFAHLCNFPYWLRNVAGTEHHPLTRAGAD